MCQIEVTHPLFYIYVYLYNVRLEVKIVLSIVVADVLYHLVEAFHFACRDFAIFHILTEEVTEGTAEILMARVREERARVGQHTYETAQKSEE